jgi:hypothetical protein
MPFLLKPKRPKNSDSPRTPTPIAEPEPTIALPLLLATVNAGVRADPARWTRVVDVEVF